MSLAILYSRARYGIDSPLVTVEAHLSSGLPNFSIVGLPETAVKESRDRVRSALLNSYFEFPYRRITVNLAPADLPKEGGRFDLPIALSILAASKQIPSDTLDQYEFVGELTLSGNILPITGIIPIALGSKKHRRTLILPLLNRKEASLVSSVTLLPANTLLDVCAHLKKRTCLTPYITEKRNEKIEYENDLSDVCGQIHARRALEIAASGEHSLLFIGPPGTGKTMLAKRLPTILPPMTEEEAIETAAVHSISHNKLIIPHWKRRPFRSPHHTASNIALVGGGNPPRPGEISLAHRGILFLDELPEFKRHVLESLREPLESGLITISRAAQQNEFPAAFQFISAMNPCPCGYYGDPQHSCRCTQEQIKRYQQKISGPILDRIDMHVNVPRFNVKMLALQNKYPSEASHIVQKRVLIARQRQLSRSNKTNAKLSNKELEKYCSLAPSEQNFLEHAIEKLNLSARRYHRILKVALTIADLNHSEKITQSHLTEALHFRGS